jgi:hypothetical protein
MVERAEPVQGAVGWLPDPVQQRQSWLVGLPSKQPALRRTLLLDNLGLQLPLLSSRPALRPGSHMAATGEPASPLSWVVYVGLAANAKRGQNGDGGHQQDPQGGSRRPSQDQQRTQPCLLRRPLSARRGRLVMRLLAGSAGPAAGDGALRPTRWSAGSVWMERSVIVFTGLSFAAAYLIAALAARWPDRWRRLRCLAPGPGRYPAGAAASRQPGLT